MPEIDEEADVYKTVVNEWDGYDNYKPLTADFTGIIKGWDGTIGYYVNGKLHRERDFAYIDTWWPHNSSYWLYGKNLTFEQFLAAQKNTIYYSEIIASILGSKEKK